MTISQRLFAIMEEKGITKAQLSKGTGLRSNTISDWQTKGTNPSADKIYGICEYLGISTDYLLTGKESSSNLSPEEGELLSIWNRLDDAGKTLVKARAIEELRRLEG